MRVYSIFKVTICIYALDKLFLPLMLDCFLFKTIQKCHVIYFQHFHNKYLGFFLSFFTQYLCCLEKHLGLSSFLIHGIMYLNWKSCILVILEFEIQ